VQKCVAVCRIVLQCIAVCCSVLQCVAVSCNVLQCVAVCCSVGRDALKDSVYVPQNVFYRIRNIEETCVRHVFVSV